MIDYDILITGGVGMLGTITSGWVSWIFARKKYNAEVDTTKIENVEKAVEVYTKIIDDVNARLEDAMNRNRLLENEVRELQKQVTDIALSVCYNVHCHQRKLKKS